MYIVIEDSPKGKSVIDNFNTLKEAENKINDLTPIGKRFCDYYITKIIASY